MTELGDAYSLAFHTWIDFEKEYANDPRDAGGETKWGIAQRWFEGTDEEWAVLNLEKATRYLYKTVWKRYHYDKITDNKLACLLFNCCGNAGADDANFAVQEAVNLLLKPFRLKVDGVLGPISQGAINTYRHPAALRVAFKACMVWRYASKGQPHYLAGWLNRLECMC